MTPAPPPPGSLPPSILHSPPGPLSRSALARLQRAECPISFDPPAAPTEPEPSIVYASASGSNVFDLDGNCFVDLASGFGAILLGHGASGPTEALARQASRTWTSLGDVFASDTKVELLERIASIHPAGDARVLPCQSGTDAITAALKTAVLHTGRAGVVAFEGAYHGLGYAGLAACGYRESFRASFLNQLNPNVVFAPFPEQEQDSARSLDAVRAALASTPIGAVLLEPILGRGGCVVPPPGFLRALAGLARAHGALLVADEIWTGLGRCGAMLASSRDGVVPDLICLGKGLGGGLPLSACVGPAPIMEAWKRTVGVVHTSTFQGNALSCATALACLDAIRDGALCERAGRVGSRFMTRLRETLGPLEGFRKVRGAGLMTGIVLSSGALAGAVRNELLRRGYIVLTGGPEGDTLTVTPALTIAEELLDGFVDELARVLEAKART